MGTIRRRRPLPMHHNRQGLTVAVGLFPQFELVVRRCLQLAIGSLPELGALPVKGKPFFRIFCQGQLHL